MMNRLTLSFCLAFISLTGALHAQTGPVQVLDAIVSKIEWYGVKKKAPNLFVHFDKNIYTSSEPVWFTAYLLASKNEINEHTTVAVSVIRNEDSTVVSDQKYVMVNGLGFGHFAMPDTLSPGDYTFLVFTNVLSDNSPAASFIQPITVKSATQANFTATLKLADKIIPGSDSAKLSFKAFAKDIHTLASFTDVTYTLGGQQKHFKTDMFGDASFSVPLKGLNVRNNRLRLKASFNKETKKIQLTLPVGNSDPIVKFFPEGGSVSAGAKTIIGWEVTNVYGQPMEISGILFRNNKPVDTIQTNGYGMGRFSVQAKTGEKYYVQLVRSEILSGNYALPAVTKQSISLTVQNGVCDNELVIHTEDPGQGEYYGMIHNYTGYSFSFAINMKLAPTRNFRVPLDSVLKGIHTLTIVDMEGRPVAERLFFAHHDKRMDVDINTDKTEYKTRENVKLNATFKDTQGDTINGLVSVACIQDNRIDPRKMTDIESYTYLNNELKNIPFKRNPMENTAENLQHWEDLLLIKGWRRYTWPDLMAATAGDTARPFSDITFRGSVSMGRKKNKKPIEISVASDRGAGSVVTDNEGQFEMKSEDLVTPPDKKIMFFINGMSQSDYIVNLKDPYEAITEKIKAGLLYENFDDGATEKRSEALVLKKGESAEVLAEVTVMSNKHNEFMFRGQKNDCGDYVCMYNILNCINHFYGGTLPEKGKMYRTSSGTSVLYAGCVPRDPINNPVKILKGIYTVKEFYPIDYAKLAPSEEVFLSTVFWNYSVEVTNGKLPELSFNLSDIPGKFRVIIQGVTTKGVVHAEQVFNVTSR
jgi:hypothetical protein